MPKAVGLMNPENAAKSAGAFKEGFVRIDKNCYKVHQGKPGEGESPVPATKWSWSVTRLAEDGVTALLDEHDEPITEELLFSLGGKCLPFVHPGRADGPDDDEPEDLGTELGVEGNTIYLNATDWKPNEKSGLMVLTKSMVAAQIKSEFLNRCWAADWNNCVFGMKTHLGDKGADGRQFNYKIVDKVLIHPGGSGAKKGKGASANGKPNDAETYLAPILRKFSEDLDGQQISRKAFVNRVKGALDAAGVDSKLLMPVLSLCKDEQWLAAHGDTFDFYLTADNTITFGSLPQV